MIVDLTPSYQTLASEIMQYCPPDFASAKLSGALEDGDVATVQLECEKTDGAVDRPRIRGMHAFTISSTLFDLQKQMHKPGHAPWSRCTFSLFPDGRFKFYVEYDD